MTKAIISDFSHVLLKPVDPSYKGGLNSLHEKLSPKQDYDFWKHFQLNNELLEFYKGLEIPVYVFTTRYIQEYPTLANKLEGVFEKIVSGARLNVKKDAEGFIKVAKELNLNPKDVFYIDDKLTNIEAAKDAGMNGSVYTTNDEAKQDIATFIKGES